MWRIEKRVRSVKAPRYTHFDVFNGDADGLCALQQLRLAQPKDAVLIAGFKGDHDLLQRVAAHPGDTVTMLDIPVEANWQALQELLGIGVSVECFDHHPASGLEHPLLRLRLDPAPRVFTSLLVDRYLSGQHRAWAVVGAFGDDRPVVAEEMARCIGLDQKKTRLLKMLGECLNYNAYGGNAADLAIPPALLHQYMAPFRDPLQFVRQCDLFMQMAQHLAGDLALAMDVRPILQTDRLTAVLLPDAAWARRVIGIYANHLARLDPGRICAVLVPNGRNAMSVSLRAARQCGAPAGRLARRHGGHGRPTAAGISDFPVERVACLLRDMQ